MLPPCHPGNVGWLSHFETRDPDTRNLSHDQRSPSAILLAISWRSRSTGGLCRTTMIRSAGTATSTASPPSLYPWSDAGLCHAIRIKQHLGSKGLLRSGLSSSGDGPLQGEGGIVVDFSGFARIAVRKSGGDGDGRIAIEVEAGATTRQLADELIRNDAFLPLGDNPVQSVVAGVLSGRPGRFDRSMGRLRDYVESLEVITPSGELAGFARGCGEFDSLLDGTFGGAIKAITFSAVTAAGMNVELMCARFVYAKAEFEAAIRLLGHPGITPGMDVSRPRLARSGWRDRRVRRSRRQARRPRPHGGGAGSIGVIPRGPGRRGDGNANPSRRGDEPGGDRRSPDQERPVRQSLCRSQPCRPALPEGRCARGVRLVQDIVRQEHDDRAGGSTRRESLPGSRARCG